MENGWTVAVGALVVGSVLLNWVSRRITRRIEEKVPVDGRFIEVDGERVHYVDEGQGPALVMIHGLTGCSRNLTYALAPALRNRYRVITLDRAGCGYSTRAPGAPCDLATQARWLAQVIQTLGLTQPLVLGHSLGGAIALALALDHPRAVSGLVLVAPLTHPQRRLPLVFLSLGIRPALLRRWLAATLATPIAVLGRRGVLKGVFTPDPVPDDFTERGGALLGMRPDSFYAASSEIATVNTALPGMVKRYATLQLPVGLIYGAQDRVLDYRQHGLALAGKVPGIQLKVLEGRGHMLPISAVEQVVAMVDRVAGKNRLVDVSSPSPTRAVP